MALPASGTLTMAQINTEFGRGNNLNAYRGTTYYTSGGGPFTFPSGAISFSNFYGTQVNSPSFSFSISSHIDQANLRSLAVAAGWNQSSAVVATLTGGYYLYSSNPGAAALTINGSWPGGVTFVNNGYVMGMGGQGGGAHYIAANNVLNNQGISNGGDAIALGVSCTIQNNSYIGGGGGGGGSSTAGIGTTVTVGYGGGGGAGGGTGGYYSNAGTVTYGGAGGGLGGSGAAGTTSSVVAGGGRIMPGSNTTVTLSGGTPTATITSTGGGAGNAGSATASGSPTSGTAGQLLSVGGSGGGTGGGFVGYSYGPWAVIGGGGGGWGASGGASAKSVGAGTTAGGAAGGFAVRTNGYGVTWSATGTRYGGIG
jgi:hypothetical protein